MEIKKNINKIDLDFRKIIDLLFFTDRMDIDVSKVKILLHKNITLHTKYIWDRFEKASCIFYENSFWNSRISILLSLKDKRISQELENKIYKKISAACKSKKHFSCYETELAQFVELCKVKSKLNIKSVKYFFVNLPSFAGATKIAKLLQLTTPFVFTSFTDYFYFLSKNCKNPLSIFSLFSSLEKQGIKIERDPLMTVAQKIIFSKTLSFRLHSAKTFLYFISDSECLNKFKAIYSVEHRKKILTFLKVLEFYYFDNNHFLNIKNILSLDSSLEDEVLSVFLEKLYNKGFSHKRACIDKILTLLKFVPNIHPKKILFWLSNNKKMHDADFFLKKFPDLNKLAAFI